MGAFGTGGSGKGERTWRCIKGEPLARTIKILRGGVE